MNDFHVHSDFSSDAEHSMESIVTAAVMQGLTEICITDHVDYDYADPSIDFDVDHPAYVAEIERLRLKFSGQIQIRHGLEIGLQPQILERCSKLVQEQKPDFVLGSMHTCGRQDLYRGDYYRSRTPRQAWENYLSELISMTAIYTDYSVLGHLDILRRYDEATAEYPIEPFKDLFMELFANVIHNDKGIEVNTSGIRGHLNSPLPSYDILRWYHEAGGKILTLGSDSHGPDCLSANFQEVIEQLKAIGFKHYCSFVDMKPVFNTL